MRTLYNFFLRIVLPFVRLAAALNPKLQRGLAGRKNLIEQCRNYYSKANIRGPRILIHVASFGELEQAKPVISVLKERYRSAHIHLTFFSPSGYDHTIGKYPDADIITYAPVDIRREVSKFLDSVKPDVALFVKYDVWPNMAWELSRRQTPAILFAAATSERSRRMLPIVKSLSAKVLRALTMILTISEEDRLPLIELGVEATTVVVAGDTRFDQVLLRKDSVEESNELLLPEKVLSHIKSRDTFVFIVGSSWETDEAIYLETIQTSVARNDNILTIIVPHDPHEEHIRTLLAIFPGKSIRYSRCDDWSGEPVIVVDVVGKLFGLYRYADIALIGGGFGAGLHNILEAAVWNIPTIVGPNHKKSREVNQLIDRLAAFEVVNKKEFDFVFWRLAQSEDLRTSAGEQALEFVKQHQGATRRIMREISAHIHERS